MVVCRPGQRSPGSLDSGVVRDVRSVAESEGSVISPLLIGYAWARIVERYTAPMVRLEVADSWNVTSPSILDQIQTEYRAGNINEAERDEMRAQVNTWFGNVTDYGTRAQYSCGMWAPSVGPMGRAEHGIILMAVIILAEEAR